MSKCKACRAEITWVKTASGRNMPCDAERISIVLDNGTVVSGHRPHWASCPDADSFRRGVKNERQ